MIGIIGAMNIEVEMLLNSMTFVENTIISGINYHKGKIENKEVVVAVAGIGKVNAAICTQTMILTFNPTIIINTGVAGGIGDNLSIGDVVIASSVVQHDMDTSAVGDPVGLISGINIVNIPCNEEVSYKILHIAERLNMGKNHIGVVATGDKFINSKEESKRIRNMFNAIACEMEGGSIGQVCYINKVDFCILRAISDSGDDDSNIDYKEFSVKAAENSKKILIEYLKEID